MRTNEHDDSRAVLQHEAEHAKPHKKVSVLGYLSILFAAAFLLLLLSYLQQQRNNAEVISGLQSSVSAVETLEELIAEKEVLSQKVTDLEAHNAQLQQDLRAAQESSTQSQSSGAAAQQQVAALDYLRRIQELYAIAYYRQAREVIAAFRAAGLEASLPTTGQVAGQTAPAETYAEICAALYPEG